MRREAGTGACRISSGFLLPPGLATEQTVRDGKIVVLVNGTEVPANVTALGRHRDESLKSVLIQFTHSMPQNAQVPATVVIGGPVRAYDDPAYVCRLHQMVINNNAILPRDPEYLCSCEMWRHLLPAGKGTAQEEKFYTDFAKDRLEFLVRDYQGGLRQQLRGSTWVRQPVDEDRERRISSLRCADRFGSAAVFNTKSRPQPKAVPVPCGGHSNPDGRYILPWTVVRRSTKR